MSKLIIKATGDIADENISSLVNDIGQEKCHESVSRIMMFNTTPPSFIEIVGSIISWKTVFITAATVFFSTLSKRFAEDVYDNKKIVGEALFRPVKAFAGAIVKAIKETANNSFVKIEIAAPDGVPNPAISFLNETEDEMAFKLSCIYAVGEKIIEKLVEVSEKYDGKIMPAVILVSEKGEITVSFYAGMNNDHVVFTISLLEPL